ncbi:MAG: GumC family protein [Elainellaceae cyanobacterium]
MESLQPAVYAEEIDFQKYWLVLKRRWLPAISVFGITVTAATVLALSEKSVYEAAGKVQIKSDRSPSLTGLDENLGQVEVLSFQGEPLETQAEIVESDPVLQETIEVLELRNDDGELWEPRYLNDVNAKPIPGTEILNISYTSEDPEFAAAVVNQVIEAYREKNIENNREEATAARRFIEEQLPATESEVLAIESRLQQFKEQNNVISLSEEASEAVVFLSEMERERSRAQEQLADVEARLAEIQDRLGVGADQALSLSALNQSAGVQTVLLELQRIQTELELERTRYRDDYPTIEVLERQETAARELLQQRIRQTVGDSIDIPVGQLQVGGLQENLIAELAGLAVERVGLIDRVAQIRSTASEYETRTNELPRLENLQRELERQLAAAQTTYETLLTQLQEVRVSENQVVGNVRVVSQASVPEYPVGPDRKLYVAAGGLAGILLGIAVAFLLDILDGSVKTVKEAKELLGYTLLGVIPLITESRRPSLLPAKRGHSASGQTSSIAAMEAFRMLQANLGFLQSDADLKSIVITSAIPQEGKTDVSANLAAAMAEAGRRVLIIDADMRHPRQHHVWNVTNRLGLSHILAGQARQDTATVSLGPSLDLLPAGVIPPNPAALLDSNRMLDLLKQFTQDYDFVILDTPPIVGAADAAVLGKMTDGVLLVVRPGEVNSNEVSAARQAMIQSNQRVLGMVANAVDPQLEPDSYFYYVGQDENIDESETALLPASLR